MDEHGRLHMPGFVGETFAETGVKHEKDLVARSPPKAASPVVKDEFERHADRVRRSYSRREIATRICRWLINGIVVVTILGIGVVVSTAGIGFPA